MRMQWLIQSTMVCNVQNEDLQGFCRSEDRVDVDGNEDEDTKEERA
jgi:hypothetical protein